MSKPEFQEVSKRVLDVVLVLAAGAVALPLLVVLAALVKLSSRGPAIYSQVRVGRGGRWFSIYKFRTMFEDCERLSGPVWSTDDDPRVTPVGRWLRRTHLDELPQLWNILAGEMSLVGPRPERPEFVVELRKALPRYAERLEAPPGLTGLAQVNLPPDVDHESVRRKLAFDLYYVEHRGLWLDLRVLAATALLSLGVQTRARARLLGLRPGRLAQVASGPRAVDSRSASAHAIPQPVPAWHET